VALRTVVILAVAGLVIAAATAMGSTPVGQRLPGTFFPFGGGGRGGPEEVAANAAATSGGTTGAAPQVVRGRGAAGGAGAANQTAPGAAGVGQQGLFSGRNMPSLQRGWSEEVRYLAIFAVLTAGVVLTLRLIRPRRRRRPGVQMAARA
jgi:hypothetical protein